MVALKPLHDVAKIKRVVVATYQSVSGAGKDAMDELWTQTRGIFVNDEIVKEHFTKQIAFNVIPHIDAFMEDGYTKEEWKMMVETKKILDPAIKLTATCVRVPVFVGHSEAVNIEFENPISAEEAREILREAPGVMVIDRHEDGGYITPVECVGEFATYVSRIREDATVENGLSLWCVSDNLRKGAALNAVQIAELMLNRGLFRVLAALIQPRTASFQPAYVALNLQPACSDGDASMPAGSRAAPEGGIYPRKPMNIAIEQPTEADHRHHPCHAARELLVAWHPARSCGAGVRQFACARSRVTMPASCSASRAWSPTRPPSPGFAMWSCCRASKDAALAARWCGRSASIRSCRASAAGCSARRTRTAFTRRWVLFRSARRSASWRSGTLRRTGRNCREPTADRRAGFIAAACAYVLWGFLPLYLKLIAFADVREVLAVRILWCIPAALAAAFVLSGWRNGVREIAAAFAPHMLLTLAISAGFLFVNWWLYVWLVMQQRVIESALAYFLAPLVAVAVGALFFRERIGGLQLAALGLALAGVIVQGLALGAPPWMALAICASWSAYAVMRKRAPAPAAAGMLVESVALAPLALGLLYWTAGEAPLASALSWSNAILLALAGPVTALPLMLFTFGARRISFAAVGLLQFLAPSLQFATGIAFGEAFTPLRGASFALIWLGLALYAWDTLRQRERSE